MWSCKVGLGRFIKQYRESKYDMVVSSMTIIAHSSLCSTGAYHLRIDLARIPLLGNIACNFKKNPTLTQDQSRRCIATRGGSESTYPCIPKAEAFDNVVDVVKLFLIPTDQAPNIRHLRVLHTFSSMTSLKLLIQQSIEEEFHQHDGVVTVMVK